MSYNTMDHAKWMEDRLACIRRQRAGKTRKNAKPIPEALSDFQKRVVDILGIVGGGIYNAPITPASIDWDYGFGAVSVIWNRPDMATFDFSQLTMLVFLAHAGRIRVDVSPAGPKAFRLSFWQRKSEGDMAVRHPNLEEAVKWFEDYLPANHRVRYSEAAQSAEVITQPS
jgi:hypothetical protein